MTLLEMTVVIMALMTLIAILYVGVRSWERGSDRAACILNIQKVQKGLRGYSNLYGYSEGSVVLNLKNKLIQAGFLDALPKCPGGGDYQFGAYSGSSGSDMIPPSGTLYMTCTLSDSDEHAPEDIAGW